MNNPVVVSNLFKFHLNYFKIEQCWISLLYHCLMKILLNHNTPLQYLKVQSFSIQPFLLKLVLKLLITQIGADFIPVKYVIH